MTLTPRVAQIDQLTCAELLARTDDRADRLLIYYNGYVDGMRRQTAWDERLAGELVERALDYCKADPRRDDPLCLHAGRTVTNRM